MSAQDATVPPWYEVATDCIGPWRIKLHGGREYSICTLTTIETTTNLLEIKPLSTQTSDECAQTFENSWLAHYPHPVKVIHDQGSEFMHSPLQSLRQNSGICSVPTTAQNPQGKSIMEAVQKSVGQVLCTLVHIHCPQTICLGVTSAYRWDCQILSRMLFFSLGILLNKTSVNLPQCCDFKR